MLEDLRESRSYKYPLYDYNSSVYQGQQEWSPRAVYRHLFTRARMCICVCCVYPKLYVSKYAQYF